MAGIDSRILIKNEGEFYTWRVICTYTCNMLELRNSVNTPLILRNAQDKRTFTLGAGEGIYLLRNAVISPIWKLLCVEWL